MRHEKVHHSQNAVPSPDAELVVAGLTVRFGGITALDDVSFSVPRGAICGLIGPNGAGKTTCFNCISGVYASSAGSVDLGGIRLTGKPRHAIARAGVGRTFQNLALFPSLSVRDNVLVGAHGLGRGGFLASMLATPDVRRSESELSGRVNGLLKRYDLDGVQHSKVNELPFATQKRVELARALAGAPRLLILDEPAGGLNHEEVDALADQIRRLRDEDGITVLLVEHHMNLVMRVSDKVVVLNFGKKIADGPPREVRANPAVVSAYLGGGE
ncbi:ABC transporter ATP-binding protein [Xenophilus aerolatus]|nr:ABC transporter ATP-binding protein [Xenophilus aerolatus]